MTSRNLSGLICNPWFNFCCMYQNMIRGSGLPADTLKDLLDASYGGDVPEGWSKDKTLGTNQNKVFVGPSGQVAVAHRGTTGTAQDWANNAAYGLTGTTGYRQTGRYKKAARVQAAAEAKYGKVITIGHSQGGLLAQELGGDEVITLNKATRPGINSKRKNKKQTDVSSSSDVVSSFGKRDKTIKAQSMNPLTEHATDVLDRLGSQYLGL